MLIEQQAIKIFGDKIVTPDALRNGKASVQESVLGNYPAMENFKGKIFFVLWGSALRDMYEAGTDGLKGRAFFTTTYFEERFQNPSTIFGNKYPL